MAVCHKTAESRKDNKKVLESEWQQKKSVGE